MLATVAIKLLETFRTSVNQQVAAIKGPTLVALCSPREHIFG